MATTPPARPTKRNVIWAEAGTATAIPNLSAAQQTLGFADMNEGFGVKNGTDKTAGGIAPKKADMNGILNELSQNDAFYNAMGGHPVFDATYAAAIGGYPIGAVLQTTDGLGTYSSMIANNTTDPNTSTNWWVSWRPHGGNALVGVYMPFAFARFTETKANGINGGSSVVGENARAFTVISGPSSTAQFGTWASLVAGKIVLTGGLYRITASSVVSGAGGCRLRLLDSAGSGAATGLSEVNSTATGNQVLHMSGRFSTTGDTFTLSTYCTTAKATSGLGIASGVSTEFYSQVELFKES